MKFYLIVAADQQRGIGIKGKLPWRLSADLRYFANITKTTEREGAQNAVIMGRKTWESIPEKYRPLPERFNIVLTHRADYDLPDGVVRSTSLDEALKIAEARNVEKVFVIGGGHVFEESLKHPDCAGVYLTEVLDTFECDTTFPEIDESKFTREVESETLEENGVPFRFVEFLRTSRT